MLRVISCWAEVLSRLDRFDEAEAAFRRRVEIRPGHAQYHYHLALTLASLGRFHEAWTHCRQMREIDPSYAEAHGNLAWMLATYPDVLRNGNATAHVQQADTILGNALNVFDALAAAYAEAGEPPVAVATARKALQLAMQSHDSRAVDALRAHIALYEAGKWWRLAPPSPAAVLGRP